MSDWQRTLISIAREYGTRELPEHVVEDLHSIVDDPSTPHYVKRDAVSILTRRDAFRGWPSNPDTDSRGNDQ